MYIQNYKNFFFFFCVCLSQFMFVHDCFACLWVSSESYLYVLGFIFASHFCTVDFHVGRFIDSFLLSFFYFFRPLERTV